MLFMFHFFSKNDFQEVDFYLEAFFSSLGMTMSAVKSRKKVATYSKPYSLTQETTFQGKHLILSLWHTPLKEKKRVQLEVVMTIENPSWVYLDIQPTNAPSKEKKILDTIFIPFLECLNEVGIKVETNDKFLVLNTFDEELCQRITQANKIGFERLTVERQKIDLKTAWLPDSTSRVKQLKQLIELLVRLATIVDNAQPST